MAKGSKLIINIMANVADVKEKAKDIEATFNKLDRTLEDQSIKSGGRMTRLGGRLQNIGEDITKVGTAVTTKLSLPLAGALGVATYHAIDFEDAFAGVRKTVEATEEQFQFLNKRIREMSTEIPASANELAEVMEIAGQLGIATEDLEKFTEVAVNMGVATNLSSEEAATALARFANIMGTLPEEYENVASAVVDLGNKNATTEREIMNMSLRLASAGKIAGLTEPEVLGISTALTSVGISAEAGGTAFSKLISSIHVAGTVGVTQMKDLEKATGMTHEQLYLMATNSPKEFRKLADSMGLPAPEMRKIVDAGWDLDKMSQIAGVSMDEFGKIIEEGPAEALEMFLIGLFETEKHGKDAIAWLNEMNINESRLRDTIQRAGGARELYNNAMRTANEAYRENVALQDEAEQKYETTASQIEMMKNAFINLAIEFGNRMLPYMKEVTQWLKDVANGIANMPAEDIDRLVKWASRIVKLGPGLAIAGKAISGIGSAMKLLAFPKSFISDIMTLSKFRKGFAENIIAKGLNPNDFLADAYKEGGWTMGIIEQLSKSVPVTMYKDGSVAALNAQSGQLKKAKHSVDEYIKSLEEAGRIQPGYSRSVIDTTNALERMSSSKVFSASLWVALGTHLFNTVKNSEAFRRGISKATDGVIEFARNIPLVGPVLRTMGSALGKVIGDVKSFFGTLTDSEAPTGDFTLAIAGVVGALTGIAPAAGAAAAVIGGFTGVMKLLGGGMDEAHIATEVTTSTLEGLNQAVTELGDPMSDITDEHLPKILSLRDDIKDSFDGMTDTIKKEGEISAETYAGMETNLQEYLDSSVTYYNAYYDKAIENMEGFYEDRHGQDATHFNDMKEMAETNRTESIERVQTLVERIMKLNNKERTHKEGLTKAEIKERERLYAELDRLEKDREETQRKRAEAEKNLLLQKLKTQGSLTKKEEEKLTAFMAEEWDSRVKTHETSYATELSLLQKKHGKNYEESAAYHRDVKTLQNKHIEMRMKDLKKFARENIEAITGVKVSEINNFREREEQYRIHQKFKKGIMDGETAMYEKSLQNMSKEERKAHDKMLRDWENNRDNVKEVLEDMDKYMDLLPESVKEAVLDSKGNFNLDFIEETVSDSMGRVGRTMTVSGNNAAVGFINGINRRQYDAYLAGRNLGLRAHSGAQQYMQERSPSRTMMESGRYVSEGYALGIEDNIGLVSDASERMAEAATVGDLSNTASMSASISREVSTMFNDTYITSLSNTVARAVARELSNAPITAVIGEDEFGEGVEEAMAYNMWRNKI